MSDHKRLPPIAGFFVVYAMLLGAAVRLYLPLTSPAPLNDGGLFYVMIQDLREAAYSLPVFTSYNMAGIPFAYPPLAFYLTGFLSDMLGVEVLDLLRLLPAVFSTLTVPAFYLLAKDVLGAGARALLPTLVYAFLPRTMDWLVMGGGITRSLGLLFAILCTWQAFRLFASRQPRHLLPTIGLGSLVVVTHPEAAVHTVISALVFYLFLDRSRRGLIRAAAAAAGILALSSPWWATIIARHGPLAFAAPLSAAGQDSLSLPVRMFALFGFQFTDEPFLTLLAALGLLGLAAQVVKREYLLPAWLFFTYVAEPRGGGLYLMLPLAMLVAIALETVILPGLEHLRHANATELRPQPPGQGGFEALLRGTLSKAAVGYVLIYALMSAFYVILVIQQRYSLKAADLEAMDWVRLQAPSQAAFVLITGERPLRDSSSEWFPALAEKRSAGTVFGYEWIGDGRFAERTEAYLELQSCTDQGPDCLDEWSQRTSSRFDCVYVRKYVEDRPVQRPIESALGDSPKYRAVYDSDAVVIFCRNEAPAKAYTTASTMTARKISAR